MKRKLSLLAATLVMTLAAAVPFTATPVSAVLDGCRAQCRVGYQKCVKEASNPGGLNQCSKAYQACLGGC
jgi:hypothetical protein